MHADHGRQRLCKFSPTMNGNLAIELLLNKFSCEFYWCLLFIFVNFMSVFADGCVAVWCNEWVVAAWRSRSGRFFPSSKKSSRNLDVHSKNKKRNGGAHKYQKQNRGKAEDKKNKREPAQNELRVGPLPWAVVRPVTFCILRPFEWPPAPVAAPTEPSGENGSQRVMSGRASRGEKSRKEQRWSRILRTASAHVGETCSVDQKRS